MNKSVKIQLDFASFICVICFLTNLSQIPRLVESAFSRYISIPVWIVFAVVCLLKSSGINLSKSKNFLTVAFIFAIYYFVSLLFNETYMRSQLPYPIFLSVFIFLVGIMSGRFITNEGIKRICTAYVLSGTIVAIYVYVNYLSGYDISSISYAYTPKNSVSQILLTSWLIILLQMFWKKGFVKKLFYVICFAFLTVTMLGLKSRATLIGIPVALFWIVFNGKIDRKLRNIILILIVAVSVFFMFNSSAYESLIDDIILGGRSSGGIDAISSGRADEWRSFGKSFSEAWLFGHGAYKKESIILASLLEYGIIGGTLILVLAVWPLLWGILRLNKTNPFYLLFTSVAIVYVVNGIFEQLAPFGPGVKCYFLWMMYGILLSKSSQISNEIPQKESEKKIGENRIF